MFGLILKRLLVRVTLLRIRLNLGKYQAARLVEEYHADGIIYEQMKFCSYWSFERTLQSHVLAEEYHIPTLSIDRPYQAKSSGQLRTRVQAFVESLEIKKIKARREKEAE